MTLTERLSRSKFIHWLEVSDYSPIQLDSSVVRNEVKMLVYLAMFFVAYDLLRVGTIFVVLFLIHACA